MKNSILHLSLLFTIGLFNVQAQNSFEVGDILILGQPTGNSYKYIHFPKNNIIIKRGAIVNFNNLAQEKLLVHKLSTNKEGDTVAVLKKKNGKKFFRFFTNVQANLTKALYNGELKLPEKENALAGE